MAITTVSSHVVSVNAIQGTLIADNAITAVHIATNAVSGTLIADNAVTATHIAQNTITVTQIADDAIEAAKIADGVITTNHLNKAMISSQTEVTPVAGDFVLLGDTSDSNNLKKAPLTLLLNSNVDLSSKLNLSGGTLTGTLTMGGMMLKPSSDGGGIGFNRNPNDGSHVGDSSLRRFQINGPDSTGGDLLQIQSYNSSGTHQGNVNIIDGKVGIGTTAPSGKFQIDGDRAGIISTEYSWGQFRVANSDVAEVGITVLNGAASNEFLSDGAPTSTNKFIMGINPYSCGTDTWGIGHGNLGDSIMHIDGSGNFGYGVNTDNPVSFYEISKSRPDVNQPSDYELKMTLNTYGYVGSGYKLALLQWLGGDTASAQDNFYAAIGATALTGTNNSEEGSLDFHVKNTAQTSDSLAVQIVGKSGTTLAGSGSHAKATLFPYQGLAIDRVWANYPGMSVLNGSTYSSTASTQAEFRFHGTNASGTSYPGTSGSDFSVDVRTDGSYVTGSDRRRKTNITTISSALSKVKQLTGKRFQTINRQLEINQNRSMADNYEFGFIAQEVESIIPESLKYNPDEDDGTENWNSAYSMNYASVVPLLVNAIKEQDTVIQDLKSRIETLEG